MPKKFTIPPTWDGFTAISKEGIPVMLTGRLLPQFRKMYAEGYFDNIFLMACYEAEYS